MHQYILLLRGTNEGLREYSPEALQHLFQQYDDWVEKMKRKARLLSAHKLLDDVAYEVRVQNGRIVSHPFAAGRETVGGYFVLSCQSQTEVLALARQCPILTHGGSVEVRELQVGAGRHSHRTPE